MGKVGGKLRQPVLVEGRLQLDVWQGKEGDKRCKLRVAAERVQFLEKLEKKSSQEENDTPAKAYAFT